LPYDFEALNGVIEPLQAQPPVLTEGESFAQGKVMDCTRHQDAPRLGATAEAGSQLDHGTEEVIALSDRFAGGHPDAQAEFTPLVGFREPALDLDGALDRSDD